MTVDAEPRRSRRRLVAAALGIVIAAVAAAVAATISLRKQDGARITMSITIDRPVDEVFAFVSDARNVLQWLPAAVARRKLTDGPVGLGTRFEATDRMFGRPVSHTQEITAFEQDRLVRTQISAPWEGTYEIRVEPAAGGTLLSVDTTARPSGAFRPLSLVPSSVMRQGFEQDYAHLKDLLEGRAEPLVTPDDRITVEADSRKTAASITVEPERESVDAVPEESATA